MKYKKVKLGEVCTYQKKSSIKAGDGENNGIYPFFTSSTTQSKFLDSFQFEEEGLIFGTGGKASVHFCNTKFSVSTDCVVLKEKKPETVFLRYVYYVVLGNMDVLESGFKGAGLKHVSKDYISNLEIPLPDLPTQRHIAEVLDKADALRQQNRQLLAFYDQLLQSTFIELFGDPVKNPKGWEVKKLGEVSDARLGKMLDSKKQTGLSKFKYLGNSNVLWGKFKLDDLMEMDFTEKERQEVSLKKGDLLICEGGEVGRCAIWKEELEDCYFQKAIHRVRLHLNIIIPDYLQFLMWFYAKNGGLKDFVTVSTIAHLTGVKLKSLPIPVPPLPLQAHFAEVVAQIEVQKAQVGRSLAESEALFEGLLAGYFG